MDNNENTRLMLALGLTVLVLVVWNILFPPPKQSVKNNSTNNIVKSQDRAQVKNDSKTLSISEVTDGNYSYSKGETLTIETPKYIARINSQGGIFEEFELTHYKNSIRPDSKKCLFDNKKHIGKRSPWHLV